MKCLVVEDEFTSRLILQNILKNYGEVHIAVDGEEATEAVHLALEANAPYDLITLDVMMPKMTGYEALKAIRILESNHGIIPADGAKIIMSTSLSDGKTIMSSFKEQCDGYLVKPLDRAKLSKYLEDFNLI